MAKNYKEDTVRQKGAYIMSGIISSATEFFNNTLHSNQYEIKDASKEKIKDIYNKSVDYATMSNRAAIIAK